MTENLIVAASNLVALPLMRYLHGTDKLMMLIPMSASIIYHLAETKHNLGGIWPFNTCTGILLNIDRVGAILPILYILKYYPHKLSFNMFLYGLAALGMMMLSEKDTIYQNMTGRIARGFFYNSKFHFCVTHVIWHFMAFYGMYVVFK